MPRPTPYARAQLWCAKMPAAVSKSGGHNATFSVAMVLMQGFDLSRTEARSLLDEYNQRCEPPWSDSELEHKLNQADKQSGFTTSGGTQPRGYLRDQGGQDDREESPAPSNLPPRPEPVKATYDAAKLERAAGTWPAVVDLVWLANRSAVDPALVKPAKFLSSLYAPGEKVLVFTNDKTQGEAVWPADELPATGPRGVWFLCQPVTGTYLPNPRGKQQPDGSIKPSRRIEECVTDWRFMVLESDQAPMRLWLGAIVQLPLRIAALYTSGGRSIHALVRIDATTKAGWDAQKHAMKAGLITLGADPGALSAVRLTRLPGTMREGKDKEDAATGKKTYQRFASPALQKLLYLNPEAPLRALCDMPPKRDVENEWSKLATTGAADTDETNGAWIRDALGYYSHVSPRLRHAAQHFGTPEAAHLPTPAASAPAPRSVLAWKGSDPASYLCRIWKDTKGGPRVRTWSFEEVAPSAAHVFPSEEAAWSAYEAAGIADARYAAVQELPATGEPR